MQVLPYKRPKPVRTVRGCVGKASTMMSAPDFAQNPP